MSTSNVDISSLLSALGSSSSGINVNSAVSGAIYAARAPERVWQGQQQTLQNQTSVINQITSSLSSLSDSLNALSDPVGALTSMGVNSSNTALVTASATPGTVAGSHILVVNNLATTGSWYSASVASSSTPLAAGGFTLQVGTGTPTTITIGSGVNTLDQLASSINTQSLGVTASVVNDSSGARLAIVSNNSGSANDISITNASGLNFTRANTGKNASLTVDGIPISSASNTVSGAVTGLTINLVGAAPGTEVNLAISPDTNQISAAVSSFVNAYNTVIGQVNSQFAVDPTSQTAGPLAGDSTLRILQGDLLQAMSYTAPGSSISTAAELGITMNNDGTLSLDSSKLADAVQNNFSAVQGFLQGTASNGFAATLNTQLNTLTDPAQGAFTVDLQSINNEQTDLTNQINNFELYIANQQTVLTNEYTQADILMQQLSTQINQVQAELGLNQTNNKP
jgi:flagellar hook-associated protein 2